MEPNLLPPFPQYKATGPYTEPNKSSQHRHKLSFSMNFATIITTHWQNTVVTTSVYEIKVVGTSYVIWPNLLFCRKSNKNQKS
jgi:hypothetical protein